MRRHIVTLIAAAVLVVPSAAAFADPPDGKGGGGGGQGGGNACPEKSHNPTGTPPNCGQAPAEPPPPPPPCEGTLAHQIAGTEREEGPVSSQLHANEGQFGEAAPVVHQVSCLVATVDNNLAE
jgi:hypothetical protein